MQAPVIEIYKPPKLEIVNGGATWMTRDLTDAALAHVIVLAMGGLSIRDIADETGMTK